MGTTGPENPTKLCNEMFKSLGVKLFVPDANYFGCNILGKADEIQESSETLCKILKDNPAGNYDEQTPVIIINKVDD